MAAAATTTTTSPTSTRKILGPLITTYVAPPICSQYAEGNGPVGYAAQGCSSGNIVDTSSCWPPALVSAPGQPYFGWGFYSPGLICPSGYSSACTTALEKSGSPPSFATSFSFQFPLIPGETAVGCCPTSFTCGGGSIQTCYSAVTSGSYLAGICENTGSLLTDFQYIVVPGTNTIKFASSTAVSAITSAELLAPMFQINWQSSDKATSTTSSSSITLSSSSSKTLTTSSTPAATSSTTTATNSSGLSTGAIVAIAVVIPLVLLLIAGILAFWWFRRRRPDRNLPNDLPATNPRVSEMSGIAKDPKAFKPSELDNGAPQAYELGAGNRASKNPGLPQELDSSSPR